MYGYFYRHLLFPFFDRVVKGRQTLTHWNSFEHTQWRSRAQLEGQQLTDLRSLLTHAEATCPWYRETWANLQLRAGEVNSFQDFQSFPLLTREAIRDHRVELRTTQPLKLIPKSTGGSSGVPLQFDLDTGSNDRRTAMMYRGYRWAGGEPGTRQLFIWGGPVAGTAGWKQWKQALHTAFDNRKIINCFDFTPERMPVHVKALDRFKPEVIVAYTTPLYEFARYLDEHGIEPFSPKSIIVGAEKLHDFQRTLIERVFKCKVFETYGSREFMLIGAECGEHAGLHLSHENLYVEILDDNGHPTPAGEEGNIVITDLFNHGMPFIRYVNGDRAVAGWKNCPCGRGLPLLTRVTGRRLDTLETPDGRKIPGEFFPHLIKDFTAVRRFQVVQTTDDTIVVKLVAPDMSRESEEQLLHAITACTGWSVQIQIERVAEIPLTKAGKLRVVVREAKPTEPCENVNVQLAASGSAQ